MSTEHLILGKTIDFLTGKTIVDTHDERARQRIARFLVEKKGYRKTQIESRRKVRFTLDGEQAVVAVDFVLRIGEQAFAVVMFGPGSLVSRERSTVAAARLIESYVVPYGVITNGKDAEVLEISAGRVVSQGLDSIPSRSKAEEMMPSMTFPSLSEEAQLKEKRILFAFEVLAEKECDEFTCSLY